MADITDIKAIMYTEKTLGLQEDGVIVVQTSPRMTKNGLKEVFREFFGINPLRVNSMRVNGKVKRFRGVEGKRADLKKFYVKLPEDAQIESLAV
ncbi:MULTISPECIES: 50S ribosomal protein L23 [Sulfurovum]|jgi:large subunit ribosomal protein L23|uniref:50S ribosomal protein L23 n=1 Tax=Sulfurovum TaxID=265570 RepID=UPI001E2CFFCC|nr:MULTISPECIES: 50S ribosomal protein L23 [Sulfurovum]MDD2450384.1 50S ribosomal protein L23 [Sulfurovum sp.]MDD3498826.1 50S ribosomal protein L23 [Sulfurovum sp.]MDY0403289.1 50S ribosomal protein L23 [Sulfurovum sp.]UFH59156.1 50S ribosomal protein L23 [Sulfurovum mangrovi]